MDKIAGLRAIRGAVENIQQGDEAMAKKRYDQAADRYGRALREAPEDYAGLIQMAKCQFVQERFGEARRYADAAKRAYPGEAQALQVGGMVRLKLQDYPGALQDFQAYEQNLPGNPGIKFFQGYAYEKMGRRPNAAEAYKAFLQAVQQGPQARHAHQRLVEWGYVQG